MEQNCATYLCADVLKRAVDPKLGHVSPIAVREQGPG